MLSFSLFLLILINGAFAEEPSDWIDETTHLVINGVDANIKDYPFMVGLYYQGQFTCGASIANKNWIITAAHCFFEPPAGAKRDFSKFSIEAGNSLINKGQSHTVSKVVVHPEFKFQTLANDIALLMLKTHLSFGVNVKPVSLPLSLQPVKAGTIATLLGWGFGEDHNKPMSHLQKVNIPVIETNNCIKAYKKMNHLIQNSNVCVMSPGGGKGQCTGDSGGPLVVKSGTKLVQVGVVSFSAKPCANKNYPGVFSRVSYYVDWIHNHIGA